jgi:hypothetical protein
MYNFECVYCFNSIEFDPNISWEEAKLYAEDNFWTVEGVDWEDHSAMCPECVVLDARG